jgi:hypothetical protein
VNNTFNLTSKQWQLLSAYLDGELSDKEKNEADLLLKSEPQMVQTLENLRNTKSLLRLLPIRKVPRQYTLTRQEALANRSSWLVNSLRILSGVSAAVLIVVLAADLLQPMRMAPPEAMMESVAMQEAPAAESMAAPAEEPQLKPFEFQPAPYGMGMGGGGSAEEGIAQIPKRILPDISIRVGEPDLIDAASSETMEDATALDSVMLESTRVQDSGPILGIAPYEQQGSIRVDDTDRSFDEKAQIKPQLMLSYLIIEIILLSLALLSALIAFLIRRYRRSVH